jgi:hypothetical protein
MAAYTCPKNGCSSDDPDWCSECGANMHPAAAAASTAAPAPASVAAAPMLCPNCGTPRENNGRFCGVCRYNFETGEAYSPSSAAPAPAPAGAPAAAPPAAVPVAAAAAPDPIAAIAGADAPKLSWAVLIDFDPTVDPTASPDISRPRPRLTFPLDLPELLIGRAGAKGHPEIPVEDEGVSSRHAKIIFTDAGEPTLLELGSTNGTRINDAVATPGLPVALKSGDQIVIGRWTRMTIKAK